MTVDIDTSALMRLVLREGKALAGLHRADVLVSSERLAVESRRTIDRLRTQGVLSAEDAVQRLDIVTDWLATIDLVRLRAPVLARASEPMPSPLVWPRAPSGLR